MRPTLRAHVRSTAPLSDSMVRVVLGGGDLSRFKPSTMTDAYVKLVFQHPDAPFLEVLDLDEARGLLPAEHRPRLRAYTVSAWDSDRNELTLDVVMHGDSGLAGPWARDARPGDLIHLTGPGGGWAPDPDADWHVLAGDLSALPAIAASTPRLPVGRPAYVLIEVDGPGEVFPLDLPTGVTATWLYRHGHQPDGSERSSGRPTSSELTGSGERTPVGQLLEEAIGGLPDLTGAGAAFVHGEAGMVRRIRRLLRSRWDLTAQRLSASGYWRLGVGDEEWRADKDSWRRQVAEDDLAVAGGQ
ncbi:MAG: siderophore-interacting protein [Angustibacter sp.]